MFLVDSHCHLDQLNLTKYDNDLNKALEAAKMNGVQHMLCVCITLHDFPKVLHIAKSYPNVSATVGLHPNETDIEKEPTCEELVILGQDPTVVGVGETGLDYYRTQDTLFQEDRFRQHIRAAKLLKKPLIVHSRQAKEDTLRILREEGASQGVMHCFTEDWDMAVKSMDLGFYISFSGIVTFPNAKNLQEVVKKIPLDKMLIETDSPYLAPVPYRGQSNEPALVRYVAECIAQLKGVSLEALAESTTNNFFQLFNTENVSL